MSHPIDDLFRKGLGKAPYAFDQKGWKGARELLVLEKRKKRKLLWLFWTGGVAVASLLIFILNFNNVVEEDMMDGEILSIKVHENTRKKDKDLTLSVPLITHVGNENITPSAFALEEEQLENKDKIDQRKENGIDKIVKLEESAYGVENNNKIIQIGNKNTLAIIFEKGDKLENKVKVPIKEYVNEDLNDKGTNGQISVSFVGHEQAQSDAKDWASVDHLTGMDIQPLMIKKSIISIPDVSQKVETKKAMSKFEKSLYGSYVPSESGWEAGLGLTYNFNRNWSIGLALGIGNYNESNGTLFENVASRNQNLSVDVSTINNYSYKSIVVPIKLSYHMKKHAVFAGAILKRAFYLSGNQEASINTSTDMQSMNPTVGMFNGPITSSISYNLDNVPELDRVLIYGQLGYGYRLNSSFDVTWAVTYRFDNQNRILPLIANPEASDITNDSFGGYIRVDYKF